MLKEKEGTKILHYEEFPQLMTVSGKDYDELLENIRKNIYHKKYSDDLEEKTRISNLDYFVPVNRTLSTDIGCEVSIIPESLFQFANIQVHTEVWKRVPADFDLSQIIGKAEFVRGV